MARREFMRRTVAVLVLAASVVTVSSVDASAKTSDAGAAFSGAP